MVCKKFSMQSCGLGTKEKPINTGMVSFQCQRPGCKSFKIKHRGIYLGGLSRSTSEKKVYLAVVMKGAIYVNQDDDDDHEKKVIDNTEYYSLAHNEFWVFRDTGKTL